MKVHLHVQDASGRWVPALSDTQGGLGGGGGGVPTSWRYAAAGGGIADTSDVTLAAAPGANRSNYLKSLQYHNKDGSVGTEVVIKDGSTVIWRGFAPANMVTSANVSFDIPLSSSPNTALNAAAITTSAELYLNAQGYVDASLASRQADLTLGEEITDDDGNWITSDTNEQLYLA